MPQQPVFRIEKNIGGSAHIKNITARPNQQSDPAALCDFLRCRNLDTFVHGNIFFHDPIRDKDKDPSFSAKQSRAFPVPPYRGGSLHNPAIAMPTRMS